MCERGHNQRTQQATENFGPSQARLPDGQVTNPPAARAGACPERSRGITSHARRGTDHHSLITGFLIDTAAIRNVRNSLKINDGRTF